MSPLVSVVVPVFNGLPHLRDLVQSLLNQDYPNLEFIFSEGGGSDGSRDYLLTLNDPRVQILHMPPGTGAAANWTAATMAATGEFTKLICQDDLLAPHAITQQVDDLIGHPEAVMAIAQRDIVDAGGRELYADRGLSGINLPHGAVINGDELLRTCYLQGTNVIGEPLAVLFRTDALKRAMPWDDSNPLMLDLSTYQKVAAQRDVVIRRGSVGAFRVSSSSWSTKLAKEQLQQTKLWQDEYVNSIKDPIPFTEQLRARIGRHRQTLLRRIAYRYLRVRGALQSQEAS